MQSLAANQHWSLPSLPFVGLSIEVKDTVTDEATVLNHLISQFQHHGIPTDIKLTTSTLTFFWDPFTWSLSCDIGSIFSDCFHFGSRLFNWSRRLSGRSARRTKPHKPHKPCIIIIIASSIWKTMLFWLHLSRFSARNRILEVFQVDLSTVQHPVQLIICHFGDDLHSRLSEWCKTPHSLLNQSLDW